jgi:transcriptional regulator with XRE-family HTH domain
MDVKPLSTLETIRRERRMLRYQVASAIGVSDQTMRRWERGEAHPPLDDARRLADHYGVTLDQLAPTDDREAV